MKCGSTNSSRGFLMTFCVNDFYNDFTMMVIVVLLFYLVPRSPWWPGNEAKHCCNVLNWSRSRLPNWERNSFSRTAVLTSFIGERKATGTWLLCRFCWLPHLESRSASRCNYVMKDCSTRIRCMLFLLRTS